MTEPFYFRGDTLGRGRNGWFKAHQATFWSLSSDQTTGIKLFLEVRSKQIGHTSPIMLELALADAMALGQRLIEETTALQTTIIEQGGNPWRSQE